MKNYYNILQVSSEADAQQIQKAFRRLSLRYHPDRNGGRKDYEEKFKEINEAYQVLKDPIRRWQYRRDIQPRSGASRFSKKWETPDFSTRHRRAEKTEQQPPVSASSDLHSFFWSCILLLVFFLPFSMIEEVPAQSADRAFVSMELDRGDFDTGTTLDVQERIDRRYKRDFYYLQEIRKADPGLRGLNTETGYYELNGKSIRLSWDILKLIREKKWKK